MICLSSGSTCQDAVGQCHNCGIHQPSRSDNKSAQEEADLNSLSSAVCIPGMQNWREMQDVDLLASRFNNKLDKFVSCTRVLPAIVVDALVTTFF